MSNTPFHTLFLTLFHTLWRGVKKLWSVAAPLEVARGHIMEPRLGDIAKGGLAKVQSTKYLFKDFWTFAKPPFAMSPDERSKHMATCQMWAKIFCWEGVAARRRRSLKRELNYSNIYYTVLDDTILLRYYTVLYYNIL